MRSMLSINFLFHGLQTFGMWWMLAPYRPHTCYVSISCLVPLSHSAKNIGLWVRVLGETLLILCGMMIGELMLISFDHRHLW